MMHETSVCYVTHIMLACSLQVYVIMYVIHENYVYEKNKGMTYIILICHNFKV